MKIVILTSYFQPKLGYLEVFLAQEFQKMGHDVFVVTSNYYFPFPDYKSTVFKVLGKRKRQTGIFTERGIKIYRLPFLYQSRNGAVTLLRGIRKTLSKIKPDAVFVYGVFSPLAVQAAQCKKILKFKIFYSNHASEFNTKLRSTFSKRIYMHMFKKVFIPHIRQKADGFIAVGESEGYLLSSEYEINIQKIKIIRPGANIPKHYFQKRKGVREKLDITKEEKLIIYAGKITENKDINILLRAYKLVNTKVNNAKLLILGGGESVFLNKIKTIVDNELGEKVLFHPPVQNRYLQDYYCAADLGVWPGDLSLTIIEAMACGLPIVLPEHLAKGKGQTTKHLVKYKNGLQFKRGNISELAEKITYLLSHSTERKIMGKASLSLAKKEFSWRKVALQHIWLYENS